MINYSIHDPFAFMSILDDIDGAGVFNNEVRRLLSVRCEHVHCGVLRAPILYRKSDLPLHNTRGRSL